MHLLETGRPGTHLAGVEMLLNRFRHATGPSHSEGQISTYVPLRQEDTP